MIRRAIISCLGKEFLGFWPILGSEFRHCSRSAFPRFRPILGGENGEFNEKSGGRVWRVLAEIRKLSVNGVSVMSECESFQTCCSREKKYHMSHVSCAFILYIGRALENSHTHS